jgi:hypothetical protein
MVNNYFKNKHSNSELREETTVLPPDDLLNDLSIAEGGWKPDQDELTVVSKRTDTLKFELDYWKGDPPRELRDIIVENIDEGYPVIPFINGERLRKGTRMSDGAHAVVVAGYGDDQIALHDPMGYPEDIVPYKKLEDAWDPLFSMIVTTSLSNRGTKILEEDE